MPGIDTWDLMPGRRPPFRGAYGNKKRETGGLGRLRSTLGGGGWERWGHALENATGIGNQRDAWKEAMRLPRSAPYQTGILFRCS